MAKTGSVRGIGFAHRADVEDVVAWLDENTDCLDHEPLPVGEASRRILSRSLVSEISVPAFRRAMMDGYAVQSESIQGASSYNRIPLQVFDRSMPGQPATSGWPTDLPAAAIEIMTGAPFPEGANAVLPFELTDRQDGQIFAIGCVAPLKNIGEMGEDLQAGDEVLPAGRSMRAQDIGIAASIGLEQVQVYVRPRVRILITGNEIVPPGKVRGHYQIFDSNGPMLVSLVERDGGIAERVYCDDVESSIAGQMTSDDFDVLLVSGGSSVGKEDLAPSLVSQLGNLQYHGIAMRPSSPTGLGKLQDRLVFLLPGNPVSCMCAYDFFAGRAIRKMGGRCPEWPYPRVRLKLEQKISSVIGRVDYCRVQVVNGRVRPIAIGGASVLTTLSRADGFVIIDRDSEGIDIEQPADVFLFE